MRSVHDLPKLLELHDPPADERPWWILCRACFRAWRVPAEEISDANFEFLCQHADLHVRRDRRSQLDRNGPAGG